MAIRPVVGGIPLENKNTHIIAVQFKDGKSKKSLLEIDDKVYKVLLKRMLKDEKRDEGN